MKKKIVLLAMLCLSLLLLSGCSELSGSPNNGEEEPVVEVPAGAIFPVLADEEKGIKSRSIELRDFTLELPEGYVYGKVDYEVENASKKKNTYSAYYVWMDNNTEREYIFETDSCILLYIYEGVDTNTPQKELTAQQLMTSIRSYASYFTNMVAMKEGYYEQEPVTTTDSKYNVLSFTGQSGNYITTTYNDICYPKAYYGFFLGSAVTDNGERNFSGFVFSNEEEGEIFTRKEYDSLMKQIKSGCKIGEFNGIGIAGLPPKEAKTNGFSYDELVDEALYTNTETGKIMANGVFYKALLYYVNMDGRDYERWNVDGKPKPVRPIPTESEAEESTDGTTEESTELTSEATDKEVHVHTDDCCGLICGVKTDEHSHSADCIGFICEYAGEESGAAK